VTRYCKEIKRYLFRTS